jgi:membrane dipeptidase
MMRFVDAHLDIAYNALEYGRDLILSVNQIRESEQPDFHRGVATVSFPQLREAGGVLLFGTLFTASAQASGVMGSSNRFSYGNQEQAHQQAMEQLDYYHRIVDVEQNNLRLVTSLIDLEAVLDSQQNEDPLLGIVILMEGADAVRDPGEVTLWAEKGVRAIGPAWDDTKYAAGSFRDSRHGLTRKGQELLEVMADEKLILDLSHMNETAALEALDQYEGLLMASHSNTQALVPGRRQLSDLVIRRIGEHEGVIGIVFYNPFLRPNQRMGDPKELVTLDHVVAHIDHICQILGDATHVGLGTDMDGGFGKDDIPTPMDSIADIPLLIDHLKTYGYSEEDIARILGENWLNLLRTSFSP